MDSDTQEIGDGRSEQRNHIPDPADPPDQQPLQQGDHSRGSVDQGRHDHGRRDKAKADEWRQHRRNLEGQGPRDCAAKPSSSGHVSANIRMKPTATGSERLPCRAPAGSVFSECGLIDAKGDLHASTAALAGGVLIAASGQRLNSWTPKNNRRQAPSRFDPRRYPICHPDRRQPVTSSALCLSRRAGSGRSWRRNLMCHKGKKGRLRLWRRCIAVGRSGSLPEGAVGAPN